MEYATVDGVKKGFEAANSRMNSIEEKTKDCDLAVKDFYQHLKNLTDQLKLYGRSIRSASERAGDYQGFCRDEAMAKEVGTIAILLAGGRVKDMGTIENPSGGVFVPSAETTIWFIQMMGKYGKFRQNASIIQMGNNKINIPRITTDLVVTCPGEGTEIEKSDIKADHVSLLVKKFACFTVINRELEEDAIVGLGEIVFSCIVRSLAKKEDEIGFMGDGTKDYFGMLGIVGALRKIAADITTIPGIVIGSGNNYADLTLDDFQDVVGVLPSDADDGAKFYMNKKFYYGTVYKLARSAGVANIFEILSNQKGRYLLGYEVVFIPSMPSTEANSQICAILGDLKLGAYLGERRAIEIAKSTEFLFQNDQVCIRGTERIDINIHGVGDTTNPGPIVALATAAA